MWECCWLACRSTTDTSDYSWRSDRHAPTVRQRFKPWMGPRREGRSQKDVEGGTTQDQRNVLLVLHRQAAQQRVGFLDPQQVDRGNAEGSLSTRIHQVADRSLHHPPRKRARLVAAQQACSRAAAWGSACSHWPRHCQALWWGRLQIRVYHRTNLNRPRIRMETDCRRDRGVLFVDREHQDTRLCRHLVPRGWRIHLHSPRQPTLVEGLQGREY